MGAPCTACFAVTFNITQDDTKQLQAQKDSRFLISSQKGEFTQGQDKPVALRVHGEIAMDSTCSQDLLSVTSAF